MKTIEELKEKYLIKDRKLLYSYTEGYIGKNVYQVTLNDGTVKKSEQILKNKRNGDAVVIIPVTELNRFVIIIESRPNVENGVAIEFPAGMVDPNESFATAALRELEEETGYTSSNLIELEWHYQDQGCSKAIIKTFVALNCKKIKEQNLGQNENISFIEVDENELNELYNQNELQDANSKIAYLTYTLKKTK